MDSLELEKGVYIYNYKHNKVFILNKGKTRKKEKKRERERKVYPFINQGLRKWKNLPRGVGEWWRNVCLSNCSCMSIFAFGQMKYMPQSC